MTLLTVKQAMKRVHRSKRTIETWITDGLPVAWYSNVRYIRVDHLIAELKKRNAANPASAWDVGKDERRAARVKAKLAREHLARHSGIRM